MAKLMIICLACTIVAASLMTSCCAARGLPPSWRSGEIPKSTETTTSSSKSTSDMTFSNEELLAAEWEQLVEEEMGPCMEYAKGSEKVSKPCHRMLGDYSPPSHNPNPKGPW